MSEPEAPFVTGLPLVALVRRSSEFLRAHGVQSPEATAETLLMHHLGVDRAGLYARSAPLDPQAAKAFGRSLCARCSGTPLQHVTGEQQFMDLSLRVEPGVFVPRPETEGLVVAALETLRGAERPVVVDVGTGTGAVALAVAHHRPDANVLATDVSEAAVTLARSNADRLRLAVDVRLGDLLEPLPAELRGRVNLVVSNPPYIEEEAFDSLPLEVRSEPREALVGGTQLHTRLATDGPEWLRPGGWLVVEIGDDQGPEVRSLLSARFELVEVLTDLAGRDRLVRGRLRRADAAASALAGAASANRAD